MPIHVYLTAALVAGALAVFVATLLADRVATVRSGDAQNNLLRGGEAHTSRQVALSAPARDRLLDPVFGAIAQRARGLSSAEWMRKSEHKLMLSGLTDAGWTIERLLVIRFLSGGLGLALAGLLVSGSQTRNTVLQALLILAIGFLGPNIWVDRKATERQTELERRLPDTIDQLAVNIETGLGFDTALAKIANGRPNALATEFRRVLQDIQMGASRTEAFEWLLERTDVSDLRQFVSAIRQSTQHGIPISTVLQVQSEELRQKRQGRIEEKAAQLPVKIVFPLVLFILPALFVIVLGPAALSVGSGF